MIDPNLWVVPIEGEELRYYVRSRRKGVEPHLVDLEEYAFNGQCNCEDFQFNKQQFLERGAAPHHNLRCFHINRAREFFLERQLRAHSRGPDVRTSEIRYCLSVRQPWAWLQVHGYKDVENRSRKTAFQGPCLIHAGLEMDDNTEAVREWCWIKFGLKLPDTFDRGGIVGFVIYGPCVDTSSSPWFTGPFGYPVRKARPLPFTPCKGQLGFFRVPQFKLVHT